MESLFYSLIVVSVVGLIMERRHIRSLRRREVALAHLPLLTLRRGGRRSEPVASAVLVTGNAVLTPHMFKRFMGSIRLFFGGQLHGYTMLMTRARREALLRMKEQAVSADVILNVRVETANVGGDRHSRNGLAAMEVVAYGTAVTYRKKGGD